MGGKTTLWLGILFAVITAVLLGWNGYRMEQAQRSQAFLRLSPNLTLAQGATIPPDMLETIYLPESARSLASAAIADTPQNREWLRDRRASRDVAPGSILFYQFFSDDPGSRFAATIPPGMRAVSINVDPAGAVSYLIEPGSQVDVIGLFEVVIPPPETLSDFNSALEFERRVAKTVLQNVRVLAVGGAASRGAYAPEISGAGLGTVTLELSPEQVEALVFAQGIVAGPLLLALRNPADNETRTIAERSWRDVVK